MSELKIEKGIPIPLNQRAGGFTEFLAKMAVGDSFLAPKEKVAYIRGNIGTIGKKINAKFLTRTVEGALRVWRVK
jgi:hypothetical protein